MSLSGKEIRKILQYVLRQLISDFFAGLWIVTVYNIFRKKYSFL